MKVLSDIIGISVLSLIMFSIMVEGYFRVGKKETLNQNDDLLAIPIKYVRVIRQNKRQGPTDGQNLVKRALPPDMYRHHAINNPFFNPAPMDKYWSPYENILFVKKRGQSNQGETATTKREISSYKERRDVLDDPIKPDKVQSEIMLIRKKNIEDDNDRKQNMDRFGNLPPQLILLKRSVPSEEEKAKSPDVVKLTMIRKRGPGDSHHLSGENNVFLVKESDMPRVGKRKTDLSKLVMVGESGKFGEEERRNQINEAQHDSLDGDIKSLQSKPVEIIVTE